MHENSRQSKNNAGTFLRLKNSASKLAVFAAATLFSLHTASAQMPSAPEDAPPSGPLLLSTRDGSFVLSRLDAACGDWLRYGGEVGLNHCEPLAEKNDIYAQYVTGALYMDLATEEDVKTAVGWMEKAAAGGLSQAAMVLGSVYARGISLAGEVVIQSDYAAAEKWFLRAAELKQYNAYGMIGVMQLYSAKKPLHAAYAFRQGAEKGDVLSVTMLGTMLWEGKELKPAGKNTEAIGRELLKLAADAGNMEASFQTGVILSGGSPEEQKQAYVYFMRAAKAGSFRARSSAAVLGRTFDERTRELLNKQAVEWKPEPLGKLPDISFVSKPK